MSLSGAVVLENIADSTFEDMRIQFGTSMRGDIVELRMPLEDTLDAIVFDKQAEQRMSDPTYLQRFVGVYAISTQELTIALQGKSLTANIPGQPVLTLEPARADEFDVEGIQGFSIRFETGENGTMSAWLHQPNGVFEAKRKQ